MPGLGRCPGEGKGSPLQYSGLENSKASTVVVLKCSCAGWFFFIPVLPSGIPGSSAGKESTCSPGDPSSIPGSGRSPGEGIGYPLQYSWASWWRRWQRILLQCGRHQFDPWVGKIPQSRAWQPTPVSLPGESPWTEDPGGLHPWGRKELDMTEWPCTTILPYSLPCPLPWEADLDWLHHQLPGPLASRWLWPFRSHRLRSNGRARLMFHALSALKVLAVLLSWQPLFHACGSPQTHNPVSSWGRLLFLVSDWHNSHLPTTEKLCD